MPGSTILLHVTISKESIDKISEKGEVSSEEESPNVSPKGKGDSSKLVDKDFSLAT